MSTPSPASVTHDQVLLIIDVQRDFCPGGQLAIREGDAVVAIINQVSQCFEHIVVTQDWHPSRHTSFASSHPGKNPYDQIELGYGRQTLWPDHCVQQTSGADFHPGLDIGRAELILRKGFRSEIDSYSAFFENDRVTPTGLAGYLRERGIKRITLAGLAYDYCVRFSAIDGQRAGFETTVIRDACRAVGLGDSVESTRQELAMAGVTEVEASSFWLRSNSRPQTRIGAS